MIHITNCCENFAQRKTSPLEKVTQRFQTAHFRPDLKLIVGVQGDRELVRIDANAIDTYGSGGLIPASANVPEINLHEYWGKEQAYRGVMPRSSGGRGRCTSSITKHQRHLSRRAAAGAREAVHAA